MQLGPYQLSRQLGAGPDGLAYEAIRDGGEPVELWSLELARQQPQRWPVRVKRLRQVELLEHPCARPLVELQLDHAPPFVVLPAAPTTTLAARLTEGFVEIGSAVRALRDLADGLRHAHQLGLVHGRLCGDTLWIIEPFHLLADFTGLSYGGSPAPATDPSDDVHALGALLWQFLFDEPPATGPVGEVPDALFAEWDLIAQPVRSYLPTLLHVDPAARPRVDEVVAWLNSLLDLLSQAETQAGIPAPLTELARPPDPSRVLRAGDRLGRFVLEEKLGEGGMGTVFLARDLADNTRVAIKTLKPSVAESEQTRRRFFKEARMLADVNNPYVANLLEFNEDAGVCYLAIEYVEGKSVADLLARQGKLPEQVAVSILCDVARALVDPHRRQLVHRDVKPENILLLDADVEESLSNGRPARVKLSDFGVARYVNQSESMNLTHEGTALGTPLYMSPEQWGDSRLADPRSDVYAMGATLFHLLTGRPPFEGEDVMTLMTRHLGELPQSLVKLDPEINESLSRIVEKSLAKKPADRQPDADALLQDLMRLLRGQPQAMEMHPRMPGTPGHAAVGRFEWQLESSPEDLWPFVSNTDRLNHAIGLPPVTYRVEYDPQLGTQRFAECKLSGVTLAWQEHPYEWIENKRLSVFRNFTAGPFTWFVSIVELQSRPQGGTTLRHTVKIEPKGLIGKVIANVEVNLKARRNLGAAYQQIDEVARLTQAERASRDPFAKPSPLSSAQNSRVDERLGQLARLAGHARLVDLLGDFLRGASPMAVSRIRPFELADRLGADRNQFLDVCLAATHCGLLSLLWDILCPVCRIPAEFHDRLSLVESHGECEACRLKFDVDLGNSVELVFRAHPEIRQADTQTYCIGGPSHYPHIVSQIRVAGNETFELDLNLSEGAYLLRGPQLAFSLELPVRATATATRWEVNLSVQPPDELLPPLRPGGQRLVLVNDEPFEILVRVERAASREDAVTAAYAASLARFRELFPSEVLSPGMVSSIPTMTFLVTTIERAGQLYYELGDLQAFDLLHRAFRAMQECFSDHGGTVFKYTGGGVQAVFQQPLRAVEAGLALPGYLQESPELAALAPRVGAHRGPAMITTVNDRLDYFGTTINTAVILLRMARDGELVLTHDVFADPEVAALLAARESTAELATVQLPNGDSLAVQRVTPGSTD